MKEKIVLKYKKEKDLSEQKLTLNDRVDNIFKSGWVNEITYLSNLMQDTRMCLEELQQENKQLKEEKRKVRDYINKHCVNEKISKEVGYKCYTMADTNELEKIMKILGDKENE